MNLHYRLIFFIIVIFLYPIYAQNNENALQVLKKKGYKFDSYNFFKAIEKGKEEIVILYLKAGMDPNVEEFYGTPLNFAIEEREKEIIKILLKAGANPNATTGRNDIPLVNAIKKRSFSDIVKLLIEFGADVNLCKNGDSPLEAAFISDRDESLEYLLEHGADPTLSCGEDTPLIRAISSKKQKLVKQFLEQGADVNAKGSLGMTPLMTAARSGKFDTFKLLLDSGADINAKDDTNRDVMHWAQLGKSRKIINFLKQKEFVEIKGIASREKERIKYFNEYLQKAKFKEALEVIRQEIIFPKYDNDEYKASIRNYGIFAIQRYCRTYGITPNLVREAESYYSQGTSYAPDDGDLEMYLHLTMGQLLFQAADPMQGIDKINWALDVAKKNDNLYGQVLCYQSLGLFYLTIGQTKYAIEFNQKALSVGKKYFIFGKSPKNDSQWQEYCQLIQGFWQIAATDQNPKLVLALYNYIKPAIHKYYKNDLHPFYTDLVLSLAISGDIKHAVDFIPLVKKYAENEKESSGKIGNLYLTEIDTFLVTGTLALLNKKYDIAIKKLEYFRKVKENNKLSGVKLDFDWGLYRSLALAYEYAGYIDKAIELREKKSDPMNEFRQNLSLDLREKMMNNQNSREWYEGLSRLYVKRFKRDSSYNDFFYALKLSEFLHSRQLYERISESNYKPFSEVDLIQLQNHLSQNDLVVSFTLNNSFFNNQSHLITFIFGKNFREVSLNSVDQNSILSIINSIVLKISNPNSNIDILNIELSDLSNMILGNVRKYLENTENIYFVLDGKLNLIPPELYSATESIYKPLIYNKAVSLFPSLQLLSIDLKNTSEIRLESLIAVADPIFNNNFIKNYVSIPIDEKTMRSIESDYFYPLPETRSEVREISKLFNPDKIVTLIGEYATESRFKALSLYNFNIIHIASHGIIGNEIPGITEPAIVFGQESNNNGLLLASEVEKLKLNADLTVLSACKTGLGEFVEGEGLMGISRSFMIAGSRSLVVSLWSVNSLTTEMLMVKFYQNLKNGMNKAEALRSAKIFIMKMNINDLKRIYENRGFKLNNVTYSSLNTLHPFFWAPFVLVGR